MKIRPLGLGITGMAILALAACSDSTGGGGGRPAHVTIVSGDAQTGTVGAVLPQPLVIKVTNSGGHAVKAQPVSFVVLSGGGSVTGGTVTDGSGTAQATWTLGTTPGPQQVEARALDPSTGQPVVSDTFQAVAVHDVPARIDPVGAAQRDGTVGDPLADSLAVVVRDRFLNPVPGVVVTWSAATGGGSVSPATSTTNAAGVAKAAWTLGPTVGQQSATATAGSLVATFTANASQRMPALLVRISGDGQHAAAGALLPAPLVVQALDSLGRPAPGDVVSFYDPAVSGFATVTTGADGMASFTPHTEGTPVFPLVITRYRVTDQRHAVYFAASSDPAITATVPVNVDGTIVDARYGKVAWIETATGSVWVLDRATNTQTRVAAAGSRAWLTPSGVVYVAGSSVYAWRSGTATGVGDSTRVQVAGEYVLMHGPGSAWVYNVATGGLTIYLVPLPAASTLGANGDVYYVEGGALKRLSGGSTATLVPADSFAFRGTPSLEGTYPVYVRAVSVGQFADRSSQMVYWDGAQEQVLQSITSFRQTLPAPVRDYAGGGTLASNASYVGWKVELEGSSIPGLAHIQAFSGSSSTESDRLGNLLFYGLAPDGTAGGSTANTIFVGNFLLLDGTRVRYVSRDLTGNVRRRFVFGTGQAMFLQGETMIQLTY